METSRPIGVSMSIEIKPYDTRHIDAVVRLSLRAWAPLFDSIQKVMDREIYREQHPDWRADQKKAVEDVCAGDDTKVWIAADSGTTVGFVAVKLDPESRMGEIYMVAVDPDYQGKGAGAALTKFALERMKNAGMTTAMVETGGDPGHAPARHLYEKTGFQLFPVSRYFKKL